MKKLYTFENGPVFLAHRVEQSKYYITVYSLENISRISKMW